MKIIQVTPFISNYRFTLDRSLGLSKYVDVKWYVGWFMDTTFEYKGLCSDKHEMVLMGYPKTIQRKLKGIIAQLIYTFRSGFILRKDEADVVLIHTSRFAFLYPIIAPKHNYILQLYTTTVSTSKLKNWFWDTWRRLIMLPYKRYLIGTPEMVELFKISKKKKSYVSLWGMRPISNKTKDFTSIKLLYIGVMGPSRRIDDTLRGLRMFLDNNPYAKISYDVIGKVTPEDKKMMEDIILELKLEKFVTFHGYLSDAEIVQYFDECNVGVSYVPVTPYYTSVSVTKTMEYLLSGIPVIGTKTNWHLGEINETNGVLIDDTAKSFAEGLEVIHEKLSKFDSQKIKKSAEKWDLSYNIKYDLVPLLKNIAKNPKEY